LTERLCNDWEKVMPQTTFHDWFCLKDRENFVVDPTVNKGDAKLYFDRDGLPGRLEELVASSFIAPEVPKMMFYGTYGSGKTHTLHRVAHIVTSKQRKSCKYVPHIVHLDIEARGDSKADYLHLQLTEALGMNVVQSWIRSLATGSSDFNKAVARLASKTNIQQALKQLNGTNTVALAAWQWLTGRPLAAEELQSIGLTTQLCYVGVGDLANAVIAIGNLARAVGKCLIFFANEMEALQNIRAGDAAESWHDYFRILACNSNSSVGFVLAFAANTTDDAPRILVRTDIISRIGRQNVIELEALAAPANVKTFVEDMLTNLISRTKAQALISSQSLPTGFKRYPFTPSAFELMCDYACQDPAKSTPRNIIRTVNECAIRAWRGKKPIIDDRIVHEIAPAVFG